MSTGLECLLTEFKPNEWYYVLEQGSAPKQAWDWMEYADAYGPFDTYELACEHLHQHHANPGGHSTHSYNPSAEPSDLMQQLVAEAPQNKEWCDRTYAGPGMRVLGF